MTTTDTTAEYRRVARVSGSLVEAIRAATGTERAILVRQANVVAAVARRYAGLPPA